MTEANQIRTAVVKNNKYNRAMLTKLAKGTFGGIPVEYSRPALTQQIYLQIFFAC